MAPKKFTFVQVVNACASLWALGNSRGVHKQTFKVVVSQMSLLEVALLTCIPNVGAWGMLIWGYPRGCPHAVQSLRMLLNWDMWSVGMDRKHENYFQLECNKNMYSPTLSLSYGSWMPVPVSRPLKGGVVFINRPFKVVASQMSCFIDMYVKCGV